MSDASIRTHVFTDASADLFYKQFPGANPVLQGINFSFGLDVPESGIDVLIVYNRSSYTLTTHLPRTRTVFVAAEPDVIHTYKCRYLDQYGLVLCTSNKELKTEKWQTATCWYWFAGIDFAKQGKRCSYKGYDYFAQLKPGEMRNKISIVTSNKVFTEFHRKRIRFIEEMQRLIPEFLEVYGRGYKSIGDKADALTPCKYHLAIENGTGPDTWTEKLADPLLCWAFPFYAGCTNVETYIPEGSFAYVDLNQPQDAARLMTELLQSGQWEKALSNIAVARRRILDKYNLSFLLVELTRRALAEPVPESATGPTYLWSERSLWPEKGSRGGLVDCIALNTAMLFDRRIELKSNRIRQKLEARRSKRREQKQLALEETRFSN